MGEPGRVSGRFEVGGSGGDRRGHPLRGQQLALLVDAEGAEPLLGLGGGANPVPDVLGGNRPNGDGGANGDLLNFLFGN